MASLKVGMKGIEVAALIDELRRVGFALDKGDEYTGLVAACVRAFEEDMGLSLDSGIAGPQVQRALRAHVALPAGRAARSVKDLRYQDIVRTAVLADGGQGCVYTGYASTAPLENREAWLVPFGSQKIWRKGLKALKVLPPHTFGTCGHFAWNIISGLLNDIRRRTWRTGRMNVSGLPTKNLLMNAPEEGIEFKGALHIGYSSYLKLVAKGGAKSVVGTSNGALVAALDASGCDIFVVVYAKGHVWCIVRVHEGLSFTDPRTGLPARAGCYRFAGDGWYPEEDGIDTYSGQRHTFRRLRGDEFAPSSWTMHGLHGLADDGLVHDGPLATTDNRFWTPRLEV